jgi:hypothetical protein
MKEEIFAKKSEFVKVRRENLEKSFFCFFFLPTPNIVFSKEKKIFTEFSDFFFENYFPELISLRPAFPPTSAGLSAPPWSTKKLPTKFLIFSSRVPESGPGPGAGPDSGPGPGPGPDSGPGSVPGPEPDL